jgi:hypothetical protein
LLRYGAILRFVGWIGTVSGQCNDLSLAAYSHFLSTLRHLGLEGLVPSKIRRRFRFSESGCGVGKNGRFFHLS